MAECAFCGEEPGVGEPGEEWTTLQECSKCGRHYCNCCGYTVYLSRTWLIYCQDCGPNVERDIKGR